MSFPEPNRKEIWQFVEALFRYADPGGFVALRAFRDDIDGAWNPGVWSNPQVEENGLVSIIAAAAELAGACASAPERVVFAPPVATFKTANGAAEKDIFNGLELAVECDTTPSAARQMLENLIGPATIVVASGGEWINPETGEVEPKVHLHWRLAKPTREFAEHVRLKETRRLAKILVGADGTAVPLVHPLRWPGSWHRKRDPKLAHIVALQPEREIDLDQTYDILRGAVAELQTTKPNGLDRPHSSSVPQADPLDVAAALAIIPNNNLPWDEWNKIGLATWRATGGWEPGFAAFCAWSAKSSKFDAAVTRGRWDHYHNSPPDQIGAGTLFHMARAARRDWVKPSDQAKPQDSEPPPDFDKRAPPQPKDIASLKPAHHQFHTTRFNDMTLATTAHYLVQGLIPREGLVIVWGLPKCGKSFWVFDVGMHIALGWKYRGRLVQQGTVLYIACEGERGLAARKEAYSIAKLDAADVDPPFYVLASRLSLVTDVDVLIADICDQLKPAPIAIIIDTLNRSIDGSESSDEDMTAYIAATTRLREAFQCAVLIIHHCGIDDKRPRGHTSLTGAADGQIKIKKDNAGIITVTPEYMKDGAEGDAISCRLAVVEVGTDENGTTISSCVIDPVEDGVAPTIKKTIPFKLSAKDQIALDTLNRALAAEGKPAPRHNHIPHTAAVVSVDLWRRFYLAGTSADDQREDTRRKAWRDARDRLLAKHIIGLIDEMVWVP